MSVTAAVVLLPATPAMATTCVLLHEPGVDNVLCLVYGTPGVRQLCDKLVIC